MSHPCPKPSLKSCHQVPVGQCLLGQAPLSDAPPPGLFSPEVVLTVGEQGPREYQSWSSPARDEVCQSQGRFKGAAKCLRRLFEDNTAAVDGFRKPSPGIGRQCFEKVYVCWVIGRIFNAYLFCMAFVHRQMQSQERTSRERRGPFGEGTA